MHPARVFHHAICHSLILNLSPRLAGLRRGRTAHRTFTSGLPARYRHSIGQCQTTPHDVGEEIAPQLLPRGLFHPSRGSWHLDSGLSLPSLKSLAKSVLASRCRRKTRSLGRPYSLPRCRPNSLYPGDAEHTGPRTGFGQHHHSRRARRCLPLEAVDVQLGNPAARRGYPKPGSRALRAPPKKPPEQSRRIIDDAVAARTVRQHDFTSVALGPQRPTRASATATADHSGNIMQSLSCARKHPSLSNAEASLVANLYSGPTRSSHQRQNSADLSTFFMLGVSLALAQLDRSPCPPMP